MRPMLILALAAALAGCERHDTADPISQPELTRTVAQALCAADMSDRAQAIAAIAEAAASAPDDGIADDVFSYARAEIARNPDCAGQSPNRTP